MRDRFLFYGSFWEALSSLSDEQKGQCLTVISEYALYGKEPSLENPVVRMFFTLVRPQIDANNQRFENGSKGGSRKKTEENPKNNQDGTKEEPKPNQKITEEEPNDNQTETETEGNKKEKEKENKKNNISSDKSSEILQKNKQKTFSDEFEQWWKECPKKVSKDDAYRKFNTILAGGIATFDDLFDGIKRYAEHCAEEKTEPHYIKHPSTWLNQGCWKDEYPIKWKTIDAKPDAYEEFTLAVQEMKRRAAE